MTNKQELDNFAMESIPILKRYGYIKNKSSFAIFFLLGIIFTGVLFYGIQTDAFKSVINQKVELEPEIKVYNDYEFTPETNNNYDFQPNYTIINNLICP